MTTLTYRTHARIEDLRPGECTIHPCGTADGKRWWNLWFYVYRDDRAGVLVDLVVPVNPRGPYIEDGPGGRTWGLALVGDGRWQVSPSINVLAGADGDADRVHPGDHPQASVWHQTPTIVGVPAGEPWQ